MINRKLIQTVMMLLLSACFCAVAQAQAPQVTVRAIAAQVPVKAVGLVFSDQGVFQTDETNITEIREGEYLISFAAKRLRQSLGTNRNSFQASAILELEDGSKAYAYTTQLKANGDSHPLAGPACDLRTSISTSVKGQSAGIFHQLIKLREDKRQNHIAELSRKLTPDFKMKIERLEKSFGLFEGTEISASREPYILIQRLSRLQNAISVLKSKQKLSEDKEQAKE